MQQSLFKNVIKKEEGIHKKTRKKIIKIEKSQMIEEEPINLLKGFTKMKALTFSSSFKMLENLIDMGYSNIELIISLSSDYEEIQERKLIKILEDEINLTKGILKSNLVLKYLPNSHSKFYILENEEGKKRLILGSLNFSLKAWTTSQMEEILYTDTDVELIKEYEELFEKIKEKAKDIIKEKDREKIKEKARVKNINIDKMELTRENVEAIKELSKNAVGFAVKNISVYLDPKVIKKKAEKAKEKISVEIEKIKQIAENRNLIITSKIDEAKKLAGLEKEEELKKSITYNEELKEWRFLDIFAIRGEEKKAVECLENLSSLLEKLNEHGVKRQLLYNITESILFSFAGAYLWKLRLNEMPENYPIFGILAGTSKGGKSLTLSIISMLTHNDMVVIEYAKKVSFKNFNIKLGNSSANIFEAYYEGNLTFANGILPLLVNEINENHLKDKKLYNLIKTYSNQKLFKQHGVSISSMNMSFSIPPEIARRVFFLEYPYAISGHKRLNQKIKHLITSLNSNLFFYYLSELDPESISVPIDDPLFYARNWLLNFCKDWDIKLPISEEYIGDMESKGESEIRYVFSINKDWKIGTSTDGVECYIIEKEAFRYPPTPTYLEEDKGAYYYLNKKKVDSLLKRKRKLFDNFMLLIKGGKK